MISHKREQIAIYEIFPLEEQPKLDEIALLAVDSTCLTISPRLSGDLLLFLDGTAVKVWDFVNSLWAEWDTQRDFLRVR